MKLIGYSRVSTDEQAKDGHSLGLQCEQFIKYCDVHNHELVDVIADEGVSASIDLSKRKGGARLLAALAQGEAEGVIIRDLDRMFRLTLDGLVTFAWFDRHGISVHSINECLDTTTPEAKLMLTVRLATCEFERNKTAQRTRQTMQALKADAKVYGSIPFGLLAIEGCLYKDPTRWADRQQVYQLLDDGVSYRGTVKELERRKVVAPNGGSRWNLSTISGLVGSRHDFDHIPMLDEVNDAPVSDAQIINISEVSQS